MAKKKSEEEKPLEKIVLTKLQRDFLKKIINQRETAEEILEIAGRAAKEAREKIFDRLYDFYPELKDYHFAYNAVSGIVDIVDKKKGFDNEKNRQNDNGEK